MRSSAMRRQKRKLRTEEERAYVGIEEGLIFAHKHYICYNPDEASFNQAIVECIIRGLIKTMRWESPAFDDLYVDLFGGGSCYEGLKITKPNEFDLDILMRLPEVTKPVLLENNIPGYVNLQLTNFEELQFENPALFEVMETFVDEKNYLLTKEMKGSFMQNVFNKTVKKYLPNNVIIVGDETFKIRMKNLGPAFTLTVEGNAFRVFVDLVPCILLNGDYWPGQAFKPNPYQQLENFFLVPKSPKNDMPHIDRYWRLSFQIQEREMIRKRMWMKPTIRILKRLRDRLGHKVSSYALKTLFFKELELDNPYLDDDIPQLWTGPWSYCVVHMLEVYVKCLKRREIQYFWNKKLNLLDNLTDEEIDVYREDIEVVLEDIKIDPSPATIVSYLITDQPCNDGFIRERETCCSIQ